jgi:hypothetical protein
MLNKLYYILFVLTIAMSIVAFVSGKIYLAAYALLFLALSLFEFFSKSKKVRIFISSAKLLLAIAFVIYVLTK